MGMYSQDRFMGAHGRHDVRLLRRQGRPVEEREQHAGARAGQLGRFCRRVFAFAWAFWLSNLSRCLIKISFGVAPAFLGFAIGLRSTADIFILTSFICCGIARLARFNATVALLPKDKTGKSQYFEGLPIPSSLALVSCMALCVRLDLIEKPGKGLPGGLVVPLTETVLEMHWVSVIFAIWAALMISKTLHIPKP